MKKSILVNNLDFCMRCATKYNIHTHEVFYGSANRKKSLQDGMVIGLCGKHHNLSNEGIHYDKAYDLKIKRWAEQIWIANYGTEDDFIKRYGKTYL